MSQASNTIYGDLVSSQTLNAIKHGLTTRSYAMSRLYNVSKFARKGINTIHVPHIEVESGQSVAVGGNFAAPTGDTDGSKDLTLNLKAGNPFLVKRDLNAQTAVAILKEKSREAGDNILEIMDIAVLKGLIGDIPGGGKVDFAGHATHADVITAADFIGARKYLNENKAPLNGRFCFISPKHEAEVLAIDNFVSADKIGKTSNMPIVEGFIGRLYGFDICLLNHLPKVDVAGAVNATAYKNDSYPVIFGQTLCYMWGKQLTETMSNVVDLSTADRYVPYTVYGHDELENTFAYMVSDKTTANPSS